METRSGTRKRRDSGAESVASSVGSTASEPPLVMMRSRSTTPFTLRSQCSRHGSACPEGHGIMFRSRLSPSPKRSLSKRSSKKLESSYIKQESTTTVKKNLFPLVEDSPEENGKLPNMGKKYVTRGLTKTSDYSSDEERFSLGKIKRTPASNKSLPKGFTPLKRSIEKTDYTYAQSYSYRTEVTPDRVIMMPNMTRRPIERSHSGEGFSSPELKVGSYRTSLFSSKTVTSQELKSGYGASYGTDFDSDGEVEENLKSYELTLPPPNGVASMCSSFSSGAYLRTKQVLCSLSWWMYLIICYSLLLDTYILQSSGITKLRNIGKQLTRRNTRALLLLFFLVPPCLYAGGYVYSALHAFSAQFPKTSTEKTTASSAYSSAIYPTSQPLEDLSKQQAPLTDSKLNSMMSGSSDSLPIIQSVSDEKSKWIETELQHNQVLISNVQGQMNAFDGKVVTLNAALAALQEQLRAIELEKKACCDEAFREDLNVMIDEKLAILRSQLPPPPESDSESVSLQQLTTVREELGTLLNWKRIVETREDSIPGQLTQLKDEMDTQRSAIEQRITKEIEKTILKLERELKPLWMNEIKTKLLAEITHQINSFNIQSGNGLSREEVKALIHEALGIYDSDKTGLADYALEPAGGVILSTRCTETFSSHRPRLSIWGFSLWSEPNNPRVVIQPGITPGQCWSFRGFDGYLVIQLSRKILPTAFTMEHIPKSLAPDGQIDSAPRNFTVYGLSRESDSVGVRLGEYTYESSGEPLQTFPVQELNAGYFHIVELRIHSNYGNLNYTCLYRFRVHGQVA